ANIPKVPVEVTYVLGQNLTLKCSGRSLYPMNAVWNASEILPSMKVQNLRATEGHYNTLNSTVNARISSETPLLFTLCCTIYTEIYIQPDNFTKVQSLFQKGIIFEKLIEFKPYITEHSYVKILHPSSITSNFSVIAINETERMYLWCSYTGFPQPTIIWYHNNTQLQSNSYLTITNPSVQQSAVIILQTRYERDKGTYTCEARNNVPNLINATQSHNIIVNIQ
uniref:Ig-like domain-containing protein n=1 Tax=Amphimedon queenslandica TaxID=400682 RepID=A0A1X7URB3_AMPQE